VPGRRRRRSMSTLKGFLSLSLLPIWAPSQLDSTTYISGGSSPLSYCLEMLIVSGKALTDIPRSVLTNPLGISQSNKVDNQN
jgi:hypothetical protein